MILFHAINISLSVVQTTFHLHLFIILQPSREYNVATLKHTEIEENVRSARQSALINNKIDKQSKVNSSPHPVSVSEDITTSRMPTLDAKDLVTSAGTKTHSRESKYTVSFLKKITKN